jgi:K+-sensing histidine kinase KdpD
MPASGRRAASGPPALAGEAARRGKRLDEKSPGWGLGLSIVSDLIQVIGGELAFSKSNLGGLSVVVRIPHAESLNGYPRSDRQSD